MQTKFLLAAAAFAAAATGAARADSNDPSQFVIKFEGSRTRAEVQAEAASVSATRSTEPAGSRVIAPMKTTLQPQAVRAEAVQALRLGKISAGEASL